MLDEVEKCGLCPVHVIEHDDEWPAACERLEELRSGGLERSSRDGTLTDAKVFFDATSDTRVGAPDGMKVDQSGNVYSAGPAGVWIFSPEGKHIGTLDIPERVGNVAWGGADHKTLYVAASSSIYRISLKIPGVYPHIR